MGNLMTSMWSGVSGLRTNQISLNTTAHNVSNIDTKGYVRQQMLLTDLSYNNLGTNHISTLQTGMGTNVQAIRQVRDVFLDKTYRLESGREGFYQIQSEAAGEIETILGEFGESTFAVAVDDLWSALSGVAEEPDSIVKRSLLASTASTFLSYAELLSEQLKEYQTKVDAKIQTQVDRVNAIGDELKALNTEIVYQEASGQNANDYRDRRNVLLDELSTYVNITYSEDWDGRVSVNIEGTQFVTQDKVFHLKTVELTAEDQKGFADEIDTLTKQLLKDIQDAGVSNTKAITSNSDAWKALQKYGSMAIQYDATDGCCTVTFNGIQLIKTKDGDPDNSEVLDYEARTTGFHNVIWEETGFEVFSLNGEYASYNNTDVGSLKSILIARGGYAADYTDIPQKSDYCDENGKFLSKEAEENYSAAVKKYNEEIDACLLTSTQAQLDLLVNNIVTAINDVLCPNIDLTVETANATLGLKGSQVVVSENNTININGTTYTLKEAEAAGFKILDIKNASIGMDDDETMGEALFNRKNMDRYTKAELLDNNGDPLKDANGDTIYLYIYNEEYDSNLYSQFTIGQIEVNQDILDDVSKLPLSNNKYSGLYGSYNYDAAQQIMDKWENAAIYLSPNILTPYNFTDYYDAIAGNVGTVGGLYSEKQAMLEETVYDVGNSRESVLGVASEEELTNLIMYQNAYNASSRYINAINELLETVISIGR